MVNVRRSLQPAPPSLPTHPLSPVRPDLIRPAVYSLLL
jgi:hypothetical protein